MYKSKKNMEVEQETYMLKGPFCSHCWRVHKNSYLWATNATVAPVIMVHSCSIYPKV